MYSLQHVFWRAAMALSLLVLGGVGAGVSDASRDTARACPAVQPAAWQVQARPAAAWRDVAVLRREHQRARAWG